MDFEKDYKQIIFLKFQQKKINMKDKIVKLLALRPCLVRKIVILLKDKI